MEVAVINARKRFFKNSSFEMIYFEAFANALDAGATEFNIDIQMPKEGDWSNLKVVLFNNGVGFDEKHFSKFCRLMDVDEKTHKGLGRLVYLCYFSRIEIESVYEKTNYRKFIFDENFKGDCSVEPCPDQADFAKLSFEGYYLEKIGKTNYISPQYIKDILLENFFIPLYKAKKEKKALTVNITCKIKDSIRIAKIDENDIPDFAIKEIPKLNGIFDKAALYYHIEKLDGVERKIVTALAVDGRSQKEDIIANENMPYGYKMIFLLMSEEFDGITDESRAVISLPAASLNAAKNLFRKYIAIVINEQMPDIAKENHRKKQKLQRLYPHLSGYFDVDEIGYATENEVLEKAHTKYFRDQKEILSSEELDDEKYEKSLNLSARALAEYILFRNNVIKRLKEITPYNKESEIHNIIAPRYERFEKEDFSTNKYRNNVWVLDDKFMSFRTILSEQEMTEVIKEITNEENIEEIDNDRPDIALYFSADPKTSEKLDVVIIELKRLGLKPELNSDVEIQLENRARRLSTYYGNKIQRVWFYGVVDIDNKYIMHLKSRGFAPMFSKGAMFYKQMKVYLDADSDHFVFAETFILNYDSLVNDAEIRNDTFLNILKESFSKA